MPGKLSIVATPIGNLEDITLRALRVLKEADLIACEDTRVTKKLLSHYEIHGKELFSFNANSGDKGIEKILGLLEEGKHIALVSDAGTPGLFDPGAMLVSRVRDRFDTEVKVETIAGPSAVAAAIAIAGLKAPTFTFYGFLPLKKGRQTALHEIAASERASMLFESTHRIVKLLESFETLFPRRRAGPYRELTKLYEEALIGTQQELVLTGVALMIIGFLLRAAELSGGRGHKNSFVESRGARIEHDYSKGDDSINSLN
jgi:16S rRNA (cytidine1402-2'-O)-methyltransferase